MKYIHKNGSVAQTSIQQTSPIHSDLITKYMQKVVKTAVSTLIKEHQIADRAKSFVVVCGFPRGG